MKDISFNKLFESTTTEKPVMHIFKQYLSSNREKKILFQFVATLFTMASWYMLIGIYQIF